MNAEVRQDNDGGLWIFTRPDNCLGLAWAVTEEELVPIRDAINKYLEGK